MVPIDLDDRYESRRINFSLRTKSVRAARQSASAVSLKLEGLNRNVATHAAGVVIADKKLTETVPLYKDVSANLLLPSTQFDMYSAENAGLIKFDFLGLKTLTAVSYTHLTLPTNREV